VAEEELRSGGRRPRVTLTRASIAYRAVTELGLSAAEAARHLGVTTSTVTRAVERVEKEQDGSNATFATTSPQFPAGEDFQAG
jgi:transposase